MREFLRHFFVPRHTNNHRAKALHPDAFLIYILMFSIFNLGIRVMHREMPDVLGYATDIRVEQLLSLTNQERSSKGLENVTYSEALSKAAAQKAEDMFRYNYWAHTSPEGKTPWDFIVASGYKYVLAGENLAKNFSTSKGVVDAWMASPTHKDNIVKPGYREVGFAIVNGVLNGEETTLVVQMFGTPEHISEIASLPTLTKKKIMEEKIVSSALGQQTENTFLQAVSSVVNHPKINIPTMTRDIVFLFIGLLIGLLILDGIVVYKRRVVRVSGHTVAHVLFLLGIGIALTLVQRGSLI